MAYMISLEVAAAIMMSKSILVDGRRRGNLGPENNLGLDVWFNCTGVPFFRGLGLGTSATARCFPYYKSAPYF